MKPSTTGGTTISAIARQPIVKATPTTEKFPSDSENESPIPTPSHSRNITEKTRIIERKLQEASTKGQKPTINAIAQGFQPSRTSLAPQNNDDDESETLTTIHTNPLSKTSNEHLPQQAPSSKSRINE